jgi:hypothetical protein
VLAQSGENRCLKAKARPDLKHFLSSGQVKRLHHYSNERRLGRNLTVTDTDGFISIRIAHRFCWNKVRSTNFRERIQELFIVNAFIDEALDKSLG